MTSRPLRASALARAIYCVAALVASSLFLSAAAGPAYGMDRSAGRGETSVSAGPDFGSR